MLGVVNLDKPVGPTSHDMVALMRRLTGDRRIGHAGTLDPLASGVLPILVGAATRFSQELTGGRKRYTATIRLGATSATDDGEGPITVVGHAIPDDAAIQAALTGFVGTFDQLPPAFSARKLGGRTAHRAARNGQALALAPRTVTVDSIEVEDISRTNEAVDVTIDLRCGPGTYVRSIARDLGERLGCGGYLAALRRTEAAGLRVEDAITPGQLESLQAGGRLADALLPVAELLPLPQLRLSEQEADRFRHGSRIPVSDGPPSGRLAVFDARDQLLGIGTVAGGELQPEKVIQPGSAA
ncbi:MAG TPA: tRNA pseudouridine(55) synthase TruB [Candidatus Limnocylindria bacterium]|jgi:tRNA pseudouridine55 synthase|nr:tRNA pseudouridine(55) synthase TruB [Candidatus Limnocylindria bacterium]